MRILGTVVQMPARFLARLISNHLHCRPIGGTFVRYGNMRFTVSLHCFLEEFQRRSLVTLLRHIRFKDFALVIHRAPEVVSLASDFDEYLVQVPSPLRASPYRFRPALADLMGEVSTEAVDPKPDAFVADVDPTLLQEVFDIAQRQRESDIHHHAKLDDLRRGFKAAKRVLGHFLRLNAWIAHLKSGSADNTL